MRILDYVIHVGSRSEVFTIHPLGDIHFGARGCAVKHLKKEVSRISNDAYAYAIGGGDWMDAVLPSDTKRFDFDTLPDGILEGTAKEVRQKLKDILKWQCDQLKAVLSPIPKERWLGAVEGNHCYSISKYHNRDVFVDLCNDMGIENLTDQAIIRLRFKMGGKTSVIILYIRHGYGSGRSDGAEPTKLGALLKEWEIADICFTGHSHTFHIAPPKPVLEIPRRGKLPKDLTCRYRWAANWGCWVLSHASGPASYGSRACYPARPLLSCYASIKPFATTWVEGRSTETPLVEIRQVIL